MPEVVIYVEFEGTTRQTGMRHLQEGDEDCRILASVVLTVSQAFKSG